MADVLQQIIEHKKTEVLQAQKAVPLDLVRKAAASAPPVRSFADALGGATPRIIAECKRKSPSRGVLVQDYDPVRLAKAYEAGGAAAISCLTDERFFGGTLDHLRQVRAAVRIPVLRKDFIIDPYQVYEARAAGADTFLLLSGVLTTAELDDLLALGRSLGMEPLIESHSASELRAAIATRGRIFGINNRDLKTFSVSLEIARQLYELAASGAPDRIVVCESGIHGPADIENMAGVGYKAFLIGEALVTHADPTAAVRDLIHFRP